MTNGSHLAMVKYLDHRLHQRGAVYGTARVHCISHVVLQPMKTTTLKRESQQSRMFLTSAEEAFLTNRVNPDQTANA